MGEIQWREKKPFVTILESDSMNPFATVKKYSNSNLHIQKNKWEYEPVCHWNIYSGMQKLDTEAEASAIWDETLSADAFGLVTPAHHMVRRTTPGIFHSLTSGMDEYLRCLCTLLAS